MALPSSGPISLGQVRNELKLSGPISLGQSEVRNLAGINSGKISLNDLKGKSNYIWSGTLIVREEAKAGINRYRSFFGIYDQNISVFNTTITNFECMILSRNDFYGPIIVDASYFIFYTSDKIVRNVKLIINDSTVLNCVINGENKDINLLNSLRNFKNKFINIKVEMA